MQRKAKAPRLVFECSQNHETFLVRTSINTAVMIYCTRKADTVRTVQYAVYAYAVEYNMIE